MCVLLDGYISSNKKARIKGHIINHIQFLVKRNVTAYIKIAIQGYVSYNLVRRFGWLHFQQQQGSNQRLHYRPHTVLVKEHVAAYIKIAIQGCVADNMYVLLNGYVSATTRLESKATLSTTYSFWLRDTSPPTRLLSKDVSLTTCMSF